MGILLEDRLGYDELLPAIDSISDPVAKLSEVRWLCQNDLFFLLVYMLKRKDADNDFVFRSCREFQADPDGHLDLWAREHYKSTIITFAGTIQEILRDPEITIGIFSHIRPLAKGFLIQIKNEFESNIELIDTFPEILYRYPKRESPKWSEDDGIVVKRKSNPKESTIEAWGLVDGMPTGKHFGLLLYDDIVTDKSVNTPDQIEKTTSAVRLSFNLGAKGGRFRMIGTRYSFNDSYRTILKEGIAVERKKPATVDGTPNGEPVLFSRAEIADKRKRQGPYIFSCQQLLNPIAESIQGFQSHWLRFFRGRPPENCNWYILVDAANGKRKHNDFTSMWVVGLGPDGNYYCIPAVRDRLNLAERIRTLFALHRDFKPLQVRYEEYGLQSDVQAILLMQKEWNYRFEIIQVSGATNKHDRIRRLVPDFEHGKIWLPEKYVVKNYEEKMVDNVEVFVEEEFLTFPVPEHDDGLDALSRIKDHEGRYMSAIMASRYEKRPISLDWPKIVQSEPSSALAPGRFNDFDDNFEVDWRI